MLAPLAYFFVSSPASLARSAPVIRAPFLTVSATDPPRRRSCPTILWPVVDVGQSEGPLRPATTSPARDRGRARRRSRPASGRARQQLTAYVYCDPPSTFSEHTWVIHDGYLTCKIFPPAARSCQCDEIEIIGVPQVFRAVGQQHDPLGGEGL